MDGYSVDEYCEMLFLYGEYGRNCRETARQFAVRFPDCKTPSVSTISRVVQRFRQTGNVLDMPRPGRPTSRRFVQKEDTLAYALINPHSSIRTISENCGFSKTEVGRILTDSGAHPYRPALVQFLHAGDEQRRLDWCNFALNKLEEYPQFLENIIWSDEAIFHRSGVSNPQNTHYWALENPSWKKATKHQVRWSTKVWYGIWKDKLIGPVFYDGSLNASKYLQILETSLSEWLEDLPLQNWRDIWFQHDGAPPHKPVIVHKLLTEMFGDNIIGYGGHVEWPPRSPDLTPLDFFSLGFLKEKIYEVEPQSLQDLKNKITFACSNITSTMLHNLQKGVLSRVQKCVLPDGKQFEHLVNLSLS